MGVTDTRSAFSNSFHGVGGPGKSLTLYQLWEVIVIVLMVLSVIM